MTNAATRPMPQTIPTTFLPLDTVPTTAARHYNVRDIQTMRANFNGILAASVRQPLFTYAPHTTTAGTYLEARGFAGLSVTPAGSQATPARGLVFCCPVRVPPYCKTCSLEIYGEVQASAGEENFSSVKIYAAIDTGLPPVNSDYVTTISGTSAAQRSITVPVAYRVHRADPPGRGYFYLQVESPMASGGVKTGGAITAVGDNWLESTTAAAPSTGQVVVVETGGTPRTDIAPKLVVRTVVTVAGTTRSFLDAPWETIPLAGTDTFDVFRLTPLRIRSMSLTPDVITDFGAQVPL